jgi:YidC/Oxa1 family membrane protein insertase
VVTVLRVALLPVVVHGVRLAHASARARPHLQELAKRYRRQTDPQSVRRMMEERRRITAEHRVPRLGCLPMLLQLPIWLALCHLVSDVAAGAPVGAMSPELVASLGAATLLGVPLAERGYLGALLAYWVCNSCGPSRSRRSSGDGSPPRAHQRPSAS